MRIVVDLPPQDVAFIDEYAARTGAGSRSAVLHEAIGLLRHARLEQADPEGVASWDGYGEGG
jgi:hypothetical protein